MDLKMNQKSPRLQAGASVAPRRNHWGLALACLLAMALIAGAAQPGQQKSASGVSTQQKTGNTQIAQQNDTATDSELARQLAEESAKLLKMAADLKAEVDKTNQDSLSLAVIRKADAIEKLARNVKKEMKRTKGAS